MATREENIKKINIELEKLSDEELDKVAGGSWYISEEDAKKAGIKLLKDNGEPGKFRWYWNEGDYYWKGQKVSPQDAYSIIYFVYTNGYQPRSVDEADDFYANNTDNGPE